MQGHSATGFGTMLALEPTLVGHSTASLPKQSDKGIENKRFTEFTPAVFKSDVLTQNHYCLEFLKGII
jgi:hypothetical protein